MTDERYKAWQGFCLNYSYVWVKDELRHGFYAGWQAATNAAEQRIAALKAEVESLRTDWNVTADMATVRAEVAERERDEARRIAEDRDVKHTLSEARLAQVLEAIERHDCVWPTCLALLRQNALANTEPADQESQP
jgi:hypothetical protein